MNELSKDGRDQRDGSSASRRAVALAQRVRVPRSALKRERHRITHTQVTLGPQTYALTFTPEGVKVKGRYARREQQESYQQLVRLITLGRTTTTYGNPDVTQPAAVALDLGAVDLRLCALAMERGEDDVALLEHVKTQLTEVLGIVRAKLKLLKM